MKDIFADLYNKVLGFFRQAEVEENAKDVACNRLRVVLMQDRTNINPQLLEKIRKELVELLSKYVEMDKEALELNLEQDGEQMALMLSIPVIRAKDEDEIENAEDSDDVIGKREEEEVEDVEDDSKEGDDDDSKEDTAETCLCSEVECVCITEKIEETKECKCDNEECDCGDNCDCGDECDCSKEADTCELDEKAEVKPETSPKQQHKSKKK